MTFGTFLLALLPVAGESALVVAPAGFREALAPLLAQREREGIACEFVPLENASRESGRIEALESLLRPRFAGKEPPRYLLLAGAAASIPPPRNERADSIPDDGLFVPDGVEAAVGRLPARTPDECRRMVERILAYEARPPRGPWRARILFTAGQGGFGAVADRAVETGARFVFASTVPEGFEVRLLRLPARASGGEKALRDSCVRALEPGALFWIYAGHGSPRVLASAADGGIPAPDGGLPARSVASFRSVDAERLRCGGRAPIAFLFACETGRLSPDRECLAEALLRATDGPIGVLAASAISHPYGDLVLASEIGRAFRADPSARLGVLARRAEERAAVEVEEKERARFDAAAGLLGFDAQARARLRQRAVAEYNLFGDPMTRIAAPDSISVKAESEGDSVFVSGSVDGEGAGLVLVEVERPLGSGELGSPLARAAAEFDGPSFRVPLDLGGARGDLRVRAFAGRGDAVAAGECTFRAPAKP